MKVALVCIAKDEDEYIKEWEPHNKNEVDDFLALNYSLYGKLGK
jgi:hypothetical protein